MDRAENEIEPFPVLLHPISTRGGRFRIVVQLDTGPDLYVGIGGAQFIELIEINSGVVAIVVRERDVGEAARARAIDPRLEQRMGVALDAVTLRVGMVIGEKLRVDR
jgi:hypothetical protein